MNKWQRSPKLHWNRQVGTPVLCPAQLMGLLPQQGKTHPLPHSRATAFPMVYSYLGHTSRLWLFLAVQEAILRSSITAGSESCLLLPDVLLCPHVHPLSPILEHPLPPPPCPRLLSTLPRKTSAGLTFCQSMEMWLAEEGWCTDADRPNLSQWHRHAVWQVCDNFWVSTEEVQYHRPQKPWEISL